ncbi:MAG: alpha/beta hydrolase [Rhodobacteraceae bacterium]|nr:alpha/beta hydrolase [Paracoccaceae bacterium]
MSAPTTLLTPQGRRLAYHRLEGAAPTLVFLGGLRSDMEGTKALHLETWCQTRGQGFLRFDYSGHGQSSGTFSEGCIGDWFEDTLAAVDRLIEGSMVVVGSSMGGWLALLLAQARPKQVAGVITIAAAPDFTEDAYWAQFSPAQKEALARVGHVEIPSEYGSPYSITRRLIEEGRRWLVLRRPLPLKVPTYFLQGSADTAVPLAMAHRLFDHAQGEDMRLIVVKGKDHRFSDTACLNLIETCAAQCLDKAAEPYGDG